MADRTGIDEIALLRVDTQLTLICTAFDFWIQQAGPTVLKSHKPALNVGMPKERYRMPSQGEVFQRVFQVDEILIFIQQRTVDQRERRYIQGPA